MKNTIYKITNLINNKVYIGKTSLTIEERFKQHLKDSKKSRCEKRPLYDAINKYGKENFNIEIIETDISDEDINDKEIFYIKKYNSYVGFENSNGYNATLGGDSKKYKEYKIEDIIQKYKELNKINETAAFFNLDKSYVRRLLIANEVEMPSASEQTKRCLGKKIYQIDKDKDIILNEFASIADASEYMGKSRRNGTIYDACKARRGHHIAYNFRWYYADEWENT